MALDGRLDQVLFQRDGHYMRRWQTVVGIPPQRGVHRERGCSDVVRQDVLGVLFNDRDGCRGDGGAGMRGERKGGIR